MIGDNEYTQGDNAFSRQELSPLSPTTHTQKNTTKTRFSVCLFSLVIIDIIL